MTGASAGSGVGGSEVVPAVVLVVILIVGLWVWYAAMLARVFRALGAPAWRGWVPIVGEAELLHLGGYPRWAVVFLLVPVVSVCGLVLRGIAAHRVGRVAGYGGGATALAVLLPPVWATVLARGLARRRPGAAHRGAPTAPARRERAQEQPQQPPDGPTAPVTIAAPVRATSAPPPDPGPIATEIRAPEWGARIADPVPPVVVPAAELIAPPPGASAAAPIDAAPIDAAPIVAAPIDAAPLVAPPAPSRFAPPSMNPPPSPVPPLDTTADDMADDTTDDDLDATIVVDRAPAAHWQLVLDDGASFALASGPVILGRRPTGSDPGLRHLSVPDTTRTLSKVHARLDPEGDDWRILDLGSTNGVLVVDADGVEHVVDAGASMALEGRRFVLGRVGMRLSRTDGER